ncbi:hypothetical protein [Scytonema sp. NUACC26]|uniref:hypothetical protein n=1 Tax=Scytonema sp. NUACC26 TaxID=3140176 RepID=UPI0034DCB8CA
MKRNEAAICLLQNGWTIEEVCIVLNGEEVVEKKRCPTVENSNTLIEMIRKGGVVISEDNVKQHTIQEQINKVRRFAESNKYYL